jgi:hypothetical protein
MVVVTGCAARPRRRTRPGWRLIVVGRERGDPAQHVGELTVMSRRGLLQVVQHGRQPGRQIRLLFLSGPVGRLSCAHVSLLLAMT